MGNQLRDSHLALLGSSSGTTLNYFATASHSYLLQRILGQMGPLRQRAPLCDWSHHQHCFTKMEFIKFWRRFRSLFYFNSCDSAKHPSPQDIIAACLASEHQSHLC